MLPASPTCLQYLFFYPICTTFPALLQPSRYQKNTRAFLNQPCVQNRRTSASWHTETGPASVKHLPEYTENTTPAKGLQVKSCPWEVRPRLRSCSWDHHNSVTPQQELPGCCCGRCCLTYLCSGLDHRHTGLVPGGLLLVICSEEQNPWWLCLWRQRDAWQSPVSSISFWATQSPTPVPHHHLWCHPMPSVLAMEGKQHKRNGMGLRNHLLFIPSSVILLMQHFCAYSRFRLVSISQSHPHRRKPFCWHAQYGKRYSRGAHFHSRHVRQPSLMPQPLKRHWPKERGRKAFFIATVKVRRKQNMHILCNRMHILWSWY